MSLTEHLAGELGAAISAAAPHLYRTAASLAAEIGEVDPVRPAARQELGHYALAGQVVGQRLADLVQSAPPYAALLGAVRCGAVDLESAGQLATRWPTHRGVQPDQALMWRPTPSGWWHMLHAAATPAAGDSNVARALAHAADRIPAPGAVHTMATERARIDAYTVSAHLETVHRAGSIPDPLQQLSETGAVPVPDVLRQDVAAVLQRTKRGVDELRRYAGGSLDGSLGYAAPALVPQWADADVLLGPGGDGGFTLVDIKTVTSANADRIAGWMQQVLAYAVLDAPDRWKIRRVGLWLPRYGRVLVSPLSEVAGGLLEPAVRASVLAAARSAAAADGADTSALG